MFLFNLVYLIRMIIWTILYHSLFYSLVAMFYPCKHSILLLNRMNIHNYLIKYPDIFTLPSIWLYQAYKTAEEPDKPFWFLITLGTFSYFLAECSWILYESVLRIEVPYPGTPDLFYILNVSSFAPLRTTFYPFTVKIS